MCILVLFPSLEVQAEPSIGAKSAILMETKTGTVLYEKDADLRLSPASITKIMTVLLTMEQIKKGNISLEDQVIVSEHASSMGGSQVYLAEGEIQTLDTMLKCIMVASGNDASVAVAEHIAGSEEAFVELMNQKAVELGMGNTHFVDCCGLSDSDEHYTSARDVAVMSRELVINYPEIYHYSTIWMEDITHETKQGSSRFGLSSTNKLLKQYQWTTGLKTGSTGKAKYCISATATKDSMDMIAVVMGGDTSKGRFKEARALLSYGFANCRMYQDLHEEKLKDCPVIGGTENAVQLTYEAPFYYVDKAGRDLQEVRKEITLPESIEAPISKGTPVGQVTYYIKEEKIGSVNICALQDIPAADYVDYFLKSLFLWLLH